MNPVMLSCPRCGLSREVPREKIPLGTRNVTCPGCKERFPLIGAQQPLPGEVVSGNTSEDWTHWQALSAESSRREAQSFGENELPGITALLREGWQLYRRRWQGHVLLYLYTLLLAAGPWLGYWLIKTRALAVSPLWQEGPLLLLLATMLSVLGLIMGGGAMMQLVVREDTGVAQAIREGVRTFPGGAMLAGWLTLLLVGWSCVLLLPALVLAIWFSLSFFVFVHERERGLDALNISCQYVRGAFWDTLAKVGLLLLLLLAGSLSLVGQIVALPYVLVCLSLVYRDLRQLMPGRRSLADRAFRLRVVLPALVACSVAFGGIAVVAAFPPGPSNNGLFARNLVGIGQQVRLVLLDAWKMIGVSAPGCGLVLEKRTAIPGERVTVRIMPTSQLEQNYYLCVARDGEPCGESYVLDGEAQRQRVFFISAPQQKGFYQLKVYSDYERTSAMASLDFQVI